MANDRQNFPINTPVIVGDGPMALLLAIKLKQQGVKNVTVVGPRLGEFTRSGDFAAYVFDEVNKIIDPLKVKPSKGNHIKDLERQLYRHAKDLGVKFYDKKFVKFRDRDHIEVVDTKTEKKYKINTDLVIDCTGAAHAVLTQFNEAHGKEHFKFSDVSHYYPHQHFALLRTKMDMTKVMAFQGKDIQNPNFNPICYAVAMEKLHALGWQGNAVPYVVANPEVGDLSLTRLLDKSKVNFYFQIPKEFKNLPKEEKQKKITEFANILLWLYQNDPLAPMPTLDLHKESRRHPEKAIFSIFDLRLHQTTPSVFMGDADIPPTLHLGDATGNLPFLTGSSLMQSLPILTALLSQIKIDQGSIVAFNQNAYELIVDKQLISSMDILRNSGETQKKWIANWDDFLKIIKIYEVALQQTKDPEQRQLIEDGLKKLPAQYAMEHYEKARLHFQKNLDMQTGFKNYMFISNDINQIFDYLAEAYKYKNALTNEQIIDLEKFAAELAMHCKMFGTYFFKLPEPKYATAEKYYGYALRLYKRYLPDKFLDEQLTLYSNLMNAAYKNKDYDKVQVWMTEFQKELLPHLNLTDNMQSKLDKIYYHGAVAIFEKIKINFQNQKTASNSATLLKEAQVMMGKLSSQSINSKNYLQAEHSRLVKQLDKLEKQKQQKQQGLNYKGIFN